MFSPYERSAEVYDLFYNWVDYETHAATLRGVIEEHNPGARTVLDVACGTGRYTEQMGTWYEVDGLDLGERDFDTVGGLVVSGFGRVPRAGESLTTHGLSIEVLKNPPVFHSGRPCGNARITASATPHSASMTTAALEAMWRAVSRVRLPILTISASTM